MIPSFLDVPAEFKTDLFEHEDAANTEPHGIGETTLPPVAPAIGNAIYHAVGVRIYDLPITPEKVLQGLREKTMKN
jgi:CO/xanthine dehydrogenase Mo-binding subunit